MANILHSKAGLLLLLLAVFAVNLLETSVETRINADCQFCAMFGEKVASAAQALEGGLSFSQHDNTNKVAVYGYSLAYFFVLPLLIIGLAIVLVKRDSIEPFRVFATAIALNYWISLPFFIFFPVPERWAYPDTEAILLSDQLSEWLIRVIRPISGLDNSFPSFHVSLSIVAIGVSYIYSLRFRRSVLALAATIILSTFVLGIHWLPDIVAGMALGVLSIALAVRLNNMLAGKVNVANKRIEPPGEVQQASTLSQSKDIFLSYKSDDIDRARAIVDTLEACGLTVWWDHCLAAGDRYAERIEEELEDCRCVVVLWSEGSVDSSWVRDECSFAKNKAKPLIPVFLDRVTAPLGFGQLNAIDLIRWDGSTDDREFSRLLSSVAKKLAVPKSGQDDISVRHPATDKTREKLKLMLHLSADLEQDETVADKQVSTV